MDLDRRHQFDQRSENAYDSVESDDEHILLRKESSDRQVGKSLDTVIRVERHLVLQWLCKLEISIFC